MLFLLSFALLLLSAGTIFAVYQVNDAEAMWLTHDEAVASSLLEQGVSKETIVTALMNTEISGGGRSLLAAAGLGKQTEISMRPFSQSISAIYSLHDALCWAIFALCACHRNIRFFEKKAAIIPTGRQSIDELYQRGLLLSLATEL